MGYSLLFPKVLQQWFQNFFLLSGYEKKYAVTNALIVYCHVSVFEQ